MRGVAAKSKATEAFTKDEEEQSWSSGVLSTDNPKRLLRFFRMGRTSASVVAKSIAI
jgi:hypothetical protein